MAYPSAIQVYRKAKNTDSVASFGTLPEYDASEIKLRPSLFPLAAWIGCSLVIYAESRQIDGIRCMFARDSGKETSGDKDSSAGIKVPLERP